MAKSIANVEPKEYAKHMRPIGKRIFWHRVRASFKRIQAKEKRYMHVRLAEDTQ